MATGRVLKPVPEAVARATYGQMREGDRESAKLHLESIRWQLMKEQPDFAD